MHDGTPVDVDANYERYLVVRDQLNRMGRTLMWLAFAQVGIVATLLIQLIRDWNH